VIAISVFTEAPFLRAGMVQKNIYRKVNETYQTAEDSILTGGRMLPGVIPMLHRYSRP
jgi:hypothetical protein